MCEKHYLAKVRLSSAISYNRKGLVSHYHQGSYFCTTLYCFVDPRTCCSVRYTTVAINTNHISCLISMMFSIIYCTSVKCLKNICSVYVSVECFYVHTYLHIINLLGKAVESGRMFFFFFAEDLIDLNLNHYWELLTKCTKTLCS